jgi:hypothetical protein
MKILRALGVALIACGMAGAEGVANASTGDSAADAHPAEGPHRGSLIELGDEEFHAELVHDEDTDTITIYVLDKEAPKAMPVTARTVTLDIRAAGRSHRYTLVAKVRGTEGFGATSVFAASDNLLCQLLDVDGVSARLTIEIDGKSFVGKLGKHAHREDMD